MDGPDQLDTFGDWIKRRRRALDLTQGELAERSGCSVFAVRKIESDERRPSKQLAGLLASSLEIPPEDQPTFIKVARGELSFERLRSFELAPAASYPGEAVPGHPAGNIPLAPTPLVGRDAELAAMERLLRDPQCRLLTLTGLGGIGKTRLATEFASSRQHLYPRGVFFASLAPIDSPNLIVRAIADALGLVFSGQSPPKEQLLNHLSRLTSKAMLLVLDNLEHLLEPADMQSENSGAAALVAELLGCLPNLKILATSRERLGLRGEWAFELHGLPVPPAEPSAQIARESSAGLFIQSARRIRADFVVQGNEHLSILRICRLVEGSPLAIELAAAWIGVLTCQEIADEIESGLDFLTTSTRDIPERHRSMRAVFDHSWSLLSEDERRALRQVSVFRGGFTREAAKKVAGASLALVAVLASKSLLQRTEDGRYDLHELVRQYAAMHLQSSIMEETATRDRHSDFYLSFLCAREKALKGAAQVEAIRELSGEIDNLAAAWTWAVQHAKLAPLAASVRSFGNLYEVAGWLREGIQLLELLVQSLRDAPKDQERTTLLGRTLAQQGLLYFRLGKFDQAMALYEQSLSLLRPFNNPGLLTDPLVISGIIMHLSGDVDRSKIRMQEGLACARAADDHWFTAYALYNLGYIDSLEGRHLEGRQQMLAGLAHWRELGEPRSISLGINFLAPTLIQLGHYAEARTLLEESLSLSTQVGDRWGMGTAYRQLGLVALAEGNLNTAQSLLQKSLELFTGFVTGWDIVRTLTYLGETATASGDLDEARRIFLQALELAQEVQAVPLALDALVGLAYHYTQAGDPERVLSLCNYVLAHAASIQETKARARCLAEQAESRLTLEQVQSAANWGVSKSLETIIDTLPRGD